MSSPNTIKQINNGSYKSIQRWIIDGLNERFISVRGTTDELPHSYLFRVYKNLNPSTREVFRDVILKQLEDLSLNPNSQWVSEAGDELLLLISDIYCQPDVSRQPIELLTYILQKRLDLIKKEPNLHYRAAQTIIGLKYKPNPKLWEDVLKNGGPSYYPVVFAGLSLINISIAFQWFRSSNYPVEVFSALLRRLPWLINEYGAQQVTQFINHIASYIPNLYEEEFRLFFLQLGIPYKSKIFSRFTKKDLYQIIVHLGIKNINSNDSKDKMAWMIEKHLRYSTKSYLEYSNVTLEVEIISCLSELIIDNPSIIPKDYLYIIHNYGSQLEGSFNNAYDFIKFQRDLKHLLNEDYRKVDQRIKELCNSEKND